MLSACASSIDVEIVKTVTDFIFLDSKSLQIVTTAMKLTLGGEKKAKTVTNLDSVFKTKHYFANKGPSI